jgi:acetyl-CoA synthetase
MFRIRTFEEYRQAYRESVENPEKFWTEIAETFYWSRHWGKTLEWDFVRPDVKWFIGGKLNITESCLDRHMPDFPHKPAIIWEPNNPEEKSRTFSYRELFDAVCRFANVLKNNGVEKGDRVCLYMPMIPELAIAVLACARIGAVHSVVFGGFSASALADRINDSQCMLVVTTDGAYRGAKEIPMKLTVDEALESCPSVQKVMLYQRTNSPVNMQAGRDVYWHDEWEKVMAECPAEEMDSEDMLFILYTSGSTGKPKGVVHTAGGYMVYTGYTFANVFQHEEEDIYWCTADIGWITGHSYALYGPLLNGATTLLFEGIPTWPDAGRFWEIVEKHKVTIFYTAPTALRSLMLEGDEWVRKFDRGTLRVLGSVGEPINQEAWEWYHRVVGNEKCPIVDTWWQTETGGIMISPLAGITPLKPTFAGLPLPGVQPVLVNEKGDVLEGNDVEGLLCIRFPWPSVIRTTYGDHERCRQNYFSAFPGLYFTGDGCRRDEDGFYRIIGRVDDVMNVSGHRIGTAEVENAINEHPNVVESAVVGFPHDINGQGIYAFVICNRQPEDADQQRKEIIDTVAKMIGPFARPDKIQFVTGLPKTRSGKIMRRILRKIAEGNTADLGDTSTLLDPAIVEEIKKGAI